MRFNKHALVAVAVALLSAPGLASGQNIFDDTVSTCTTDNCSSLRIPATVFAFGPSAGISDRCVRESWPSACALTSRPAHPAPDMELVVVAPNGSVFRNDDRNGAFDRRPLVKIASAPNNGWYTVHVSQFDGAATETTSLLFYGRYPRGNANCGGATGPTLAADSLTTAAEELDDVQKGGQSGTRTETGPARRRSLVTDVAASAERPRRRARSFTRCRGLRRDLYQPPRFSPRGRFHFTCTARAPGTRVERSGDRRPPARCASPSPDINHQFRADRRVTTKRPSAARYRRSDRLC